jgi:AraC-like DNA-binding protein
MTMLLAEAVPIRELAVEMCVAGSLDKALDGYVHRKTCAFTIFAQVLQGRYEIVCGDGRRAEIMAGEAFLTGANVPLSITHHGDPRHAHRMRAQWIHAHYTLFDSVDVTSLLVLPLRVKMDACRPFEAAIGELLAMRDAPEPGLAPLARRQELAFRVLGLLGRLAPLRPDALELLRQRDRLAPVLALMKERLAAKLSVADLARQANLSPPRFHVFFRRFMGRPPMEHLKRLRLSEACRLLATGDAPLRVVAEQTGFCSEFHLSREFRRLFGMPPAAWRRQHDPAVA